MRIKCLNLLVFITLLSAAGGFAQPYQFGNLAMGGGGYVTAIITSKAEQNLVYARTDVGGAYRWNAADNQWIPLLDWVSQDETGYLGVESLATDPVAPNKLYMLVGISYFNSGKTAILRSNDYGATFTVINVTSQFKAHGNGMGRQSGEKLAIDPIKTDVLYCGTRWNGLFKSLDAGSTWDRLTGLNVTTTPNENGISFVVIDPSIGTAASGAQTLIIGVSRIVDNLYRSDDGGLTFKTISGGPANLMPQRCVLAGETLFITYANGGGPHGHWSLPEPVDKGQIWKYNLKTGSWTNITPAGVTRAFGGITIDPKNPDRLAVSTINSYFLQDRGFGDRIFLSTNGGTSWTDIVARGFDLDPNGIPWIDGHAIHWVGSIEFDPFDTNRVWITSGNGIFRTDDINTTKSVWKFIVKGLEETVPLGLISIPGGPLISVIGDYDGFRHTHAEQYSPMLEPRMGTTMGLAYASLDPDIVVRSGEKMYYSLDQGISWKECTSRGEQGYVAVSADGTVFLHAPENSSAIYWSSDRGKTWTPASGLSLNNSRPVADAVNPGKFYVYHPGAGILYTSEDGGKTFTGAGNAGGGGSRNIKAVPGREGDIWVALSNGGLSRSEDSGKSFKKINGVTYCAAVGLGKAAPGTEYPAVFIWGRVDNVTGLFRSTDQGMHWTRVNDDNHEYGGPGNAQFVEGDNNIYGRVYMSTAGRGIVYGDLAEGSANCQPTTIEPSIKVGDGEWLRDDAIVVEPGATVTFAPAPDAPGHWSWTGPQRFVSSGRLAEISNVQAVNRGEYTVSYINTCGARSSASVVIDMDIPCEPSAVGDTVRVNGQTVAPGVELDVFKGDTLEINMEPEGYWEWRGPVDFISYEKDPSFNHILLHQAGEYTATYVNSCGSTTRTTFQIRVTDPCQSTPFTLSAQVNGVEMPQPTALTADAGSDLLLTPDAGEEGSWSWTGPDGFNSSIMQLSIEDIQPEASGEYTVTFTNSCGRVSSQSCLITVEAVTSLGERNLAGGLKVYPNPAHRRFNVELSPLPQYSVLEIFDLEGQKVFEKWPLDHDVVYCDLGENFRSGVFVVRIVNGKKILSTKVVVVQ